MNISKSGNYTNQCTGSLTVLVTSTGLMATYGAEFTLTYYRFRTAHR
ncbi:hypothetical protein CCF61_004920 [Salmonella enterica subsp. enterica serovar Glostrup]|nr:hypothetical protein [Salmonella enterica subsp. enterica serovar Glostrup]EDX4102533.1 hypothetical protein [Salmonella enterica]HAE6914793.1 hypothetical protein [Salmonella enterica subsp. enterica serovar Madelia]